MVKKVISAGLVLFGLVFGPIACFADAEADLEQAAAYQQDGDYEQAEAIYKAILADYPGSSYALAAQKGLVIVHIVQEKWPTADAELAKLISGYSGYDEIADAVCETAKFYRICENYEKAKEAYQYVLDNRPDAECAIWSQMGVAISDIMLGDYGGAEAAVAYGTTGKYKEVAGQGAFQK